MKNAIILAAIVAFSTTAFAEESVKPSAPQCPAGTKLVRGAEINIANDGSGYLVERNSCEPLDETDAAKDAKAK